MRGLGTLLGCLSLCGCTRPPVVDEQSFPVLGLQTAQKSRRNPADSGLAWSRETRSPDATAAPLEFESFAAECGEWDQRLATVAAWFAERGPVGGQENHIDQLTFAMRASGAPYVWPAAWSRSARTSTEQAAAGDALVQWLGHTGPKELRRCGAARIRHDETTMLVAVVAAAPADLERPLPTSARVGQWLELRAHLRIAAVNAKVILLPPMGEPMTVPTQQTGSSVRARFAAASRGRWLIQLLASGDTGPRPMLEAMLFVDEEPATRYEDDPVPGLEAVGAGDAPDAALRRMFDSMRQKTGRAPLRRDASLDRLAADHARSMWLAQRIGHDVGDGSMDYRLAVANVHARLAGENVAHAADAARVHRALWASPSHRYNLLHRGFSRWGLGIVRDPDGSLWVCELFASDG